MSRAVARSTVAAVRVFNVFLGVAILIVDNVVAVVVVVFLIVGFLIGVSVFLVSLVVDFVVAVSLEFIGEAVFIAS